jgi:Flp pilus assembly protein TadD
VAADPALPEPRNNLGSALWRRGELARAERELRQALRINADYAEAHFNLGHTLLRAGRAADAAAAFRRAAALKPQWATALTAAAWVLATSGDPAVRAPSEAVDLARRALALAGRDDPSALDTLAVALASSGRFDEAVTTAREAAARATGTLAKDIAARLAMFERREAFVDPR